MFTKNLFGHYSDLFSIIVNSSKNGEIDFMEIERTGKLNEIRNNLDKNFYFLSDEIILSEIKKSIAKENKINLVLFNQLVAIVSLKIKSDSSISDFEKVFYIYEKIASYEETITKILIKNGKTLYYFYLNLFLI